MTDIVKLNIGGSIFQTSKSTLTKFDGFFRTMFEIGIPIIKDDSGAIFIDRDSKHFRLILNFMRDGDLDLQKYLEDVTEIQKEAEFYLLDGLVELCKKRQTAEDELKTKKQDLKYSNIHDHGLPEGFINYPVNVDLLELQEKYGARFETYINRKPFSDQVDYSVCRWCGF
ncbi:hypothetical protein B9Z55_007890 [Caenorhabditis nigoni]|uniref:BTB domain-containing protein n=1 Tax=Caenorhabditis nigoni TaxID=1611254 RepID=A0A2G5VBR7_9PELO|nr:hypothetical protein B9Z55_007887 [Caenorhabditis nigoni]PIC49211.1 hypothetical protein B9Z55_007890 [Caenorhabditis nigoni]